MHKYLLCISLLLLTWGCSYKAQPTIPPYFSTTGNVIMNDAMVNFTGNIEMLDGVVFNDSTVSCQAMNFSVEMRDEFERAATALIKSKFIGSQREHKDPYEIEIHVLNFRASFDDIREGARMAVGVLAGANKLEAKAILNLKVTVKQNGHILIEDEIHANASEQYTFWDCGDASNSVQKEIEKAAHKSLELIDRQIFERLTYRHQAPTPIMRQDNNIVEKLESLKNMYEKDLITHDEYQKMRNDVLEGF